MGGIFVVEALSVMRRSAGSNTPSATALARGRPHLKMAPLHHHLRKVRLEQETQVVIRFWIITMLLGGHGGRPRQPGREPPQFIREASKPFPARR